VLYGSANINPPSMLFSSFISCFTGTLLMSFLHDFQMVPAAPIITSITYVLTFYMRCISIVRSLYFTIFSALSSSGLDTLRNDSHLTPKKGDPHTITSIYCIHWKAHAQFHLRWFHFINTTRLQTVQSSYLFELLVHLSSDANFVLTATALLLQSAMKCD